jgi:hypothetical protein
LLSFAIHSFFSRCAWRHFFSRGFVDRISFPLAILSVSFYGCHSRRIIDDSDVSDFAADTPAAADADKFQDLQSRVLALEQQVAELSSLSAASIATTYNTNFSALSDDFRECLAYYLFQSAVVTINASTPVTNTARVDMLHKADAPVLTNAVQTMIAKDLANYVVTNNAFPPALIELIKKYSGSSEENSRQLWQRNLSAVFGPIDANDPQATRERLTALFASASAWPSSATQSLTSFIQDTRQARRARARSVLTTQSLTDIQTTANAKTIIVASKRLLSANSTGSASSTGRAQAPVGAPGVPQPPPIEQVGQGGNDVDLVQSILHRHDSHGGFAALFSSPVAVSSQPLPEERHSQGTFARLCFRGRFGFFEGL